MNDHLTSDSVTPENLGATGEPLTAADVLKLIADRAHWCRENGESDMRNILNTVRSIRAMVSDGQSREEILAAFADDEDDEDE